MENEYEKLRSMQTNLLIDVVKNYKQHGYSEQIRLTAIQILDERGIKLQTLQLAGSLQNNNYEEALDEYKKYNVNSIIAFLLYIISILIYVNNPLTSIIVYLISLIFIGCSFANTKKISKKLKDESIDYSFVFILISLFLYFFIFFVVRSQIKEKIRMIR